MKCPTCITTDLLMTDRSNIERSVREFTPVTATVAAPAAAHPPAPHPMQPQHDAQPYHHRDSHHDRHHGGYREKKSIWKELFD